MLDIKFMRENPKLVEAAMVQLGTADAPVAEALALDAQRRQVLQKVEALRAQRRAVSKKIGRTKDPVEQQALIESTRLAGDHLTALEMELRQIESQFRDAMLRIPNLPDPGVPVGKDEHENVVVKQWGEPREFDFTVLPHWEIGEALDILDIRRGVKLAGSRFYVLKGAGSHLQRALINWMIDIHVQEHGYTEVWPPVLVRSETLVGTGNLPKFAENLYHDAEEDLWLVPTAEVPVTNLYRDEILPPGSLPIYHVAYTPCFRREKAAAGKDTRGIKRVHQFDKVEMVKFVEPEKSGEELMRLLDDAEDIARRLELPYRVVQMCTGDLSFTAAIKYDVELWAPGAGEWLEVSSVSNFKDFQARRANIRYRPAVGQPPRFVHTLNGSGLALPRVMIAILENYQQRDGSVVVPQVLRPYMGGLDVIR